MCVPRTSRRIAIVTAFCCVLLSTPAFAEEDGEPLAPGEAKRLSDLLTKAAKRRKSEDVLPVLEEVGERSDPLFHKPLLKMLTHASTEVALRAAEILAAQEPASEKDRKKLGKSIWKSGWAHRANKARLPVRTHALVAAAAVEGGPLDAKRLREVEKLWRKVVGAPNEGYAPALVDICLYVRQTKDKRLCRLLAEEIDEKLSTDPNSPANPPAAWWEQRWKLWRAVNAEAVESLEALTGESFKSTDEAKAWFRENEAEFGFKW